VSKGVAGFAVSPNLAPCSPWNEPGRRGVVNADIHVSLSQPGKAEHQGRQYVENPPPPKTSTTWEFSMEVKIAAGMLAQIK
jgi:hypothetical protein